MFNVAGRCHYWLEMPSRYDVIGPRDIVSQVTVTRLLLRRERQVSRQRQAAVGIGIVTNCSAVIERIVTMSYAIRQYIVTLSVTPVKALVALCRIASHE